MKPTSEPGGHVQMLLGVYLLGGLAPLEASAVQAHLGHCAQCRSEHDDLACVPEWLGLLDENSWPG
jgi:hypothetical protein